MEYTADSESPDDFHFWTGIWTIAGALRRRVWIEMRKFQWTTNFYVILVGPPGVVTKSTTINAGYNLLSKIEGVKFGSESATWQALGDDLAAAVEYTAFVNRHGEEARMAMAAVNINVSELGTFLMMDEPKFIPFLIEMWDGKVKPFTHRIRSGPTMTIDNPWLNVVACTTPSWLQENFPVSAIGGGFTSRVVFVYGDKKRQLVPFPDELTPDAEYYSLEARLVEDLQEIALQAGEYKIAPAARDWGREWYTKHWGEQAANTIGSRYDAYRARKQTFVFKLAMILTAARDNSKIITLDRVKEAEAILGTIEPHMQRVFESIGVVDEARHSTEIISFVRAHGWLTADDLWRCVMNFMREKDFEESLKSAVRGGLLKIEVRDGRRGVSVPA